MIRNAPAREELGHFVGEAVTVVLQNVVLVRTEQNEKHIRISSC